MPTITFSTCATISTMKYRKRPLPLRYKCRPIMDTLSTNPFKLFNILYREAITL